MGSIVRNGFRLAVYPNDHRPPHCHVLVDRVEIRISLTQPPSLLSVRGKATRQQVSGALLAVAHDLFKLQILWSRYHE